MTLILLMFLNLKYINSLALLSSFYLADRSHDRADNNKMMVEAWYYIYLHFEKKTAKRYEKGIMDKYVNKMKLALNDAIGDLLRKKESIKLVSGYSLLVSKITEVTVSDFTELKLLDFVGGRKFSVDGEGKFSVVEKMTEGDAKDVVFRIKQSIVQFNDLKQTFQVVSIGDLSILDFVK